MKLTITNRKITRIGGSYGFLVPKTYLDDGVLFKGEFYDIVVLSHADKKQAAGNDCYAALNGGGNATCLSKTKKGGKDGKNTKDGNRKRE